MVSPSGSFLQKMIVFPRKEDRSLEGLSLRWAASLSGVSMGALPVGLNVLALVGAGISVSAGIPDFRSPGTGLWNNPLHSDLSRPEDMFTLSFFQSNPSPFFEFAKSIWPTGQHRPTPTHRFLKLLESKGVLLRVYTQNIDGLERLAGIAPEKLVEAHGSFSSASCIDCHHSVDIQFVKSCIFSGKTPINCTVCNGLVKPDITFFGEMLPDRFYGLFREDFGKCDLLLINRKSVV